MPLINHINQSSQIFRPNKNRWDIPPSIQFVDANTLEPVTSYNEGDYITLKYDFMPRGVQAIRPGYDYDANRWYNYINVFLDLKNPNRTSASTVGQFTGTTFRQIQCDVNTGQFTLGGSGYLVYGQITEDLKTDGPLILAVIVSTNTRAAGSNTYTSIDLTNYVKLINDNVIINDTSIFPIPKPSTFTTYTGKYTVGTSSYNNYAPHVFQTTYGELIVQHLFTPSQLTSKMGLTSGAVIKGFGLDWTSAPNPYFLYLNSGTQIWIFHADRAHFGQYYSDTSQTYYSYSNYQAAPVSGQSKNLIFGLSSTVKETLSSQPDGEFAFGYYDYQLNTNLCSTSFTWNGTDPICIEACIEPKQNFNQIYNIPLRSFQTSNFVLNPNTGNYAYTFREYCTSYTGSYNGTNLCGTIPSSRDYSIPEFRFFWD